VPEICHDLLLLFLDCAEAKTSHQVFLNEKTEYQYRENQSRSGCADLFPSDLPPGNKFTDGSLAAYSLARFQFKYVNKISILVLLIRMLPPFAAVIPIFLIMKHLELLDTRLGLIIAHTTFNLPFVVWMMREFILSLPLEIEEAGMMDGLTRLQAFYKLLLPLLKSSLVAVSIFCVIFSWSEFLLAFLLTQTEAKTMPVAIAELSWQQASVAGTAIIIPIFLFAICVQKYLIRGLTFGAIKN
jgi:multiple sugar transport system permease protein